MDITIIGDTRPWALAEGPRGWYIKNTETGRAKFVGPVRLRGTNYCDRARALAEKRNAAKGGKS